MSKQRANDLAQLQVDIELFPMPKPFFAELDDQDVPLAPKFDLKKFYAEVITFTEGEQDYAD